MDFNFAPKRFKYFVLFLCLALYASVSAVRVRAQEIAAQGKDKVPVIRTLDSSKNETVVAVSPDFVRLMALQLLDPDSSYVIPGFTLRMIYYTYPGTTPAHPKRVDFVFISNEAKAKYAPDLGFSVEVDGAPSYQAKIDYKVRDSERGKTELLIAAVPTETYLGIARGKKVQWTFGAKKYTLNDTQRKSMRALAETIP